MPPAKPKKPATAATEKKGKAKPKNSKEEVAANEDVEVDTSGKEVLAKPLKGDEKAAKESTLAKSIQPMRLGAAWVPLYFPGDPYNLKGAIKVRFGRWNKRNHQESQSQALVGSILDYGLQNDTLFNAMQVEIDKVRVNTDKLYKPLEESSDNDLGLFYWRETGMVEKDSEITLDAFGGQHRFEAMKQLRAKLRHLVPKLTRQIRESEKEMAKEADVERVNELEEKIHDLKLQLTSTNANITNSYYWRMVFYDKDKLTEEHREYLSTNQRLHLFGETKEETLDKDWKSLKSVEDFYSDAESVLKAHKLVIKKAKSQRYASLAACEANRVAIGSMLRCSDYYRHTSRWTIAFFTTVFSKPHGALLANVIIYAIRDLESIFSDFTPGGHKDTIKEYNTHVEDIKDVEKGLAEHWMKSSAEKNRPNYVATYRSYADMLDSANTAFANFKANLRGGSVHRRFITEEVLSGLNGAAEINLKSVAELFGHPDILRTKEWRAYTNSAIGIFETVAGTLRKQGDVDATAIVDGLVNRVHIHFHTTAMPILTESVILMLDEALSRHDQAFIEVSLPSLMLLDISPRHDITDWGAST
ncbi:hypothetical protein BDN72DRAFT_906947 [Pluteus cervinus]|uniref:Uncharacterized protein n=1 Tax=Pluteus cervinus TaxID=181527 RepID=A0ACD2ZY14_9AGAR|nr:hypothetical protein BDN72DRAFT_906947 [Pluteus cervinus]